MVKRFAFFVLFVAQVSAAVVGGQRPQDFYVSASGSDANPGTRANPWLTIAKVNAATFSADYTVNFRGGDTFYGQLTNTSSGTSGHPITYRSYGTGRATLSGGAVASTWTLVDAGKKIWRAAFTASTGRPRAVWVDGLRCTRARTTSVGSMTMTSTGWNSTLLASAAFPAEVEFHLRQSYWSVSFLPVESATGTTITLNSRHKQVYDASALFDVAGRVTVPYEAENIYEVFVANATAKTFFQDRTNNFIYLIPPTTVSDLNAALVIAGVRENVIALTGVSDVTIGNLAVKHTTNLRVISEDSYVDNQTGGAAGLDFTYPNGQSKGTLVTPSAAVTLDTCTRVKLVRALVMSTSNNGVKIKGASVNCELDGVIVRDCGGANLELGNPGFLYDRDQATQPTFDPQPTGTLVHDSIFRGAGVDFIDIPNIIGWYFDAATISYNIVSDSPYSNIAVGWGFGFYNPGFLGGTVIERNEVSYGMGKLTDGAGIYSNGVQETTSYIRDNWVHNISGSGNDINRHIGIYTDGGSYRHSVTGNVINSVQDYNYQLNSDDNGSPKQTPRSTPRNVMNNNTSDNSSFLMDGSGGSNTTSPNTVVSTAAAQAAGAALGTGPRVSYADVIAEEAALTP